MEAKKAELDEDGLILVNLKEDPSGKHNLSKKYPDMVAKLKKQYQDWIAEVNNQ